MVDNNNEVIKALLENQRELVKQILELTRLVTGVQNPSYPVPMTHSKDPLMMPENEEDAHYLLKNGLIDKKEFEDILQELKFYNSEITVPT